MHDKKNPPVHGLEAVSHIGKRAHDNNGHGIVQIRVAHLVHDFPLLYFSDIGHKQNTHNPGNSSAGGKLFCGGEAVVSGVGVIVLLFSALAEAASFAGVATEAGSADKSVDVAAGAASPIFLNRSSIGRCGEEEAVSTAAPAGAEGYWPLKKRMRS